MARLFAAQDQALRTSLEAVWDSYQGARASGAAPFDAAIGVAASVDRLGLAFAAGYSAALEHLIPDLILPVALCVTEADGNHPRAIKSTLDEQDGVSGYTLNGSKTFVTFGNMAHTLIIAARSGEGADGKPKLVVVRIPADRRGVSLRELPPIPFVPEIPHAGVELRDVVVEAGERMPGDGYLDYVKPFRTVEDIHVFAAATAYLLGLANRTKAPSELRAELMTLLVALDSLRKAPPLDPWVHVALHGVSQSLARLFGADELAKLWEEAPAEERSRWERDRKLLLVANKVREARFRKALSQLGLC
ncbi:MAG: acyl-CoA dehydrogenase family protein [Polyangiales bacterium]